MGRVIGLLFPEVKEIKEPFKEVKEIKEEPKKKSTRKVKEEVKED